MEGVYHGLGYAVAGHLVRAEVAEDKVEDGDHGVSTAGPWVIGIVLECNKGRLSVWDWGGGGRSLTR